MLQAQVPHVIGIHCIAHKLELAFADTVKSSEVMKQVKEVLTGCWKHYRYSAKAVRELKELACRCYGGQCGKAYKSWQDQGDAILLRAIEVLVGKNYKVLVAHFPHTAHANDSSVKCKEEQKMSTKNWLVTGFYSICYICSSKALKSLSLDQFLHNTRNDQYVSQFVYLSLEKETA